MSENTIVALFDRDPLARLNPCPECGEERTDDTVLAHFRDTLNRDGSVTYRSGVEWFYLRCRGCGHEVRGDEPRDVRKEWGYRRKPRLAALKPCPFCGGSGKTLYRKWTSLGRADEYDDPHVGCFRCGISLHAGQMGFAARRWNRRAGGCSAG